MQTRNVIAIAALTACGSLLLAGPIAPPAGSVGSTYKTLTETEPRTAINATNTPGDADSVFRITQPGSYYLTGNIIGAVGSKVGIEIATSGVTIDLAGFTLDGSTLLGQPASLDGIRCAGSLSSITIRNGTVKDWGGDGLDLTVASGVVVTDVISDNNGGVGMYPGSFARVERCHFLNNSDHGLQVASPGVVVRECTAALNGISGFRISGVATRVERCTAESNAVHGIDVSNQCVIEDNICAFNGVGSGVSDGAGIKITGSGARVIHNHTTSNDKGIWATNDNNLVYQNFASQNSVNNFERTGSGGFGTSANISSSSISLSERETYRNFEFTP